MNTTGLRILVVDDEEIVRRNLEKTLQREGFVVEQASDSQSACKKIEKYSVHLAIIDLRMPDLGGRFSERAGIELLEWIQTHHPETFVVILTGAGTVKTAIEAVNLGASDYLEKDQMLQPSRLKEKIEEIVKINYGLNIKLRQGTMLSEEDEEILRRLFTDSLEIKVSEIAKGSRGTVVYRVASRNLQGDWRIPFATKIAWKAQILQEEKNYHKWVKHRLGGARYASMLGQAVCSFNKGGINMSFLNVELAGLREFKSFFHIADVELIVQAISNLFTQTLSYWYESKEPEELHLAQEYMNYLNVERWNLDRAISRHLKELKNTKTIHLTDIDVSFANPIEPFKALLNSPDLFEKRTYLSTTHGDLHASNILVDDQNSCWLIDFSNTGRSHILRDFIELEVSIKFDLLNTDNLKTLFSIESHLLSQKDFREFPEFLTSDVESKKVLEVIKKIREYAYLTIAPNNNMQEYYIGLLFYSLNMLRFSSNAVSKNKKICILYSASLILNNLGLSALES